jgi:hypothetical protein
VNRESWGSTDENLSGEQRQWNSSGSSSSSNNNNNNNNNLDSNNNINPTWRLQ